MSTNRGNVDHGALCALFLDLCCEGITAEENALDVDAHNLVEFLFRDQIGALPKGQPRFTNTLGISVTLFS